MSGNASYKTPQALEMAVKAAAKASPQDTSRAIQGFWFHRLLCRVFHDPQSGFVLKGGLGMLARTVDARATRDIDLLARDATLDEAVERLKALAAQDLGDFVRFEFEDARPIKADDEYRSGMNLTFVPWLGAKRMQPVSVDLVVDEVPLERVDHVTQADRIDVRGIEVCDYAVYPAEVALPDKLAGIVECHGERPSSRVKDLVDIAVYATTTDVDGTELQRRLRRELGARGLEVPARFDVPAEWHGPYEHVYEKLHAQTGLPDEYAAMDDAIALVGRLLDPALAGEADRLAWSHERLAWEPKQT